MPLLYVMPAIYHVWLGYKEFGYDAIWMLPLLGLVLSSPTAAAWSLPQNVAMAAGDLGRHRVDLPGRSCSCAKPTSRGGCDPVARARIELERRERPVAGRLNVTYFVLLHNVGILWIDALCRWYRERRERFHSESPADRSRSPPPCRALWRSTRASSISRFSTPASGPYMIRASAARSATPTSSARWPRSGPLERWCWHDRRRPVGAFMMAGRRVAAGIAGVWLSGSRTGLAAFLVGLPLRRSRRFAPGERSSDAARLVSRPRRGRRRRCAGRRRRADRRAAALRPRTRSPRAARSAICRSTAIAGLPRARTSCCGNDSGTDRRQSRW